MKRNDQQLNRLFKSAAAAQPPSSAAVFALEARVMGGWRGLASADNNEFLVAWFRGAAFCGTALAAITLMWNLHQHPYPSGAELAIAQSAMGMGVEQ